MAKITPVEANKDKVIQAKTKDKINQQGSQTYKWWLATNDGDLAGQVLETVTYLKQTQSYRYRQAGIYARLYGNMPLMNFIGSTNNKLSIQGLPVDRPTMNVVQSCIDTLVSRLTQSRPRPVFLTDNGDYRERKFAKQMNSFINGEIYQTKAYEMGELLLRDAGAIGDGVAKIVETQDRKVGLERRMSTELLVDPNDALYGKPRQLFEVKLVDKGVLADMFPKAKKNIQTAEQAYADDSADSQKTISDQIIIAEAWHLPSGKDSKDGRHSIVCSSGIVFDDPEFNKPDFPFVKIPYSSRLMGFWGQGLAEQLLGTQVEINKLLITMSRAINLVGVPRVFVEVGSKVLSSALNSEVGSIIKYSGTKPVYEVAPCIPQEVYAQLERLVKFAYEQSGISALAATSQKPAGLNSGEAIRNYDDLQSDRFAALAKRYDNVYIDMAYKMADLAKDIAVRDGKYQTVFPNKNGVKQIDLPDVKKLEDPFVIQCFDSSSLPRDPAGRLQKVTELMQAGIIDIPEGRRLIDFPDLEQVNMLATAGEERILQALDKIVEDGDYTPPDPFMDLDLATKLCVQYYNLYVAAKLEESRAQMLRDFFTQTQQMKQQSMPAPQMPMEQQGAPQALPPPRPVSDLLSNVPQQ